MTGFSKIRQIFSVENNDTGYQVLDTIVRAGLGLGLGFDLMDQSDSCRSTIRTEHKIPKFKPTHQLKHILGEMQTLRIATFHIFHPFVTNLMLLHKKGVDKNNTIMVFFETFCILEIQSFKKYI